MRNRILLVIAILSLLIINLGHVYAGEPLKKNEVMNLLSGNTVKGYFMKQKESILAGRVDITIKFFSDGTAEKSTHRPKGGDFSEMGAWFVNKQGKLCMVWKPEEKKICGQLKPTSGGKYSLHSKQLTIFYEEIIPGI